MLQDKDQIKKIYSGCRKYIISRAGHASLASRAGHAGHASLASLASRAGRVSCSCSVCYVTRAGCVVSALTDNC